MNGAGERKVKKGRRRMLMNLCWVSLGDGITMHEPGAVPDTPAREYERFIL